MRKGEITTILVIAAIVIASGLILIKSGFTDQQEVIAGTRTIGDICTSNSECITSYCSTTTEERYMQNWMTGRSDGGCSFNDIPACPPAYSGYAVKRCRVETFQKYSGQCPFPVTLDVGQKYTTVYKSCANTGTGATGCQELVAVDARTCQFSPVSTCGNNIAEPGELCDPPGKREALSSTCYRECNSLCQWSDSQCIICTAGSQKCEGGNLVKCSDDGKRYNLVQSCTYGCSNSQCNPPPPPPTTTSTTTTTLEPSSFTIVQSLFRTNEMVEVQIIARQIPEYSSVAGKLEYPSFATKDAPPTPIVNGKATLNFGYVPKNTDGYTLTVKGTSPSGLPVISIGKVIVIPVIDVKVTAPQSTQYINEPVKFCAVIKDETGKELGSNDVNVYGYIRYDGETRQEGVSWTGIPVKGSLCPWTFQYEAPRTGKVIFTVKASRSGYVEGENSLSINLESSGVNIRFMTTDLRATLNQPKAIDFETLNPQGARIKTVNNIKVCRPDGITCRCSYNEAGCTPDQSLKAREILDYYSFSFAPDLAQEGWGIEIISQREGLDPGFGALTIGVTRAPEDTPPPTGIPPIALAAIAIVIIAAFYVFRRD